MLLSSAHETSVVAKIKMAIHIAQSIGDGMSKLTIIGAINAPNVQKRPKMSVISLAFTSTASRKMYLDFGRGVAFVKLSRITTSLIPSGVGSQLSSGLSALQCGQVDNSLLTRLLQWRHSHPLIL